MPMFSVIIPCFNAEETLPQALSALSKQSFEDFEIIIVDDGSTDSSSQIAHAFAATDERAKVVELTNGGPSRARNIGALVHATGDYLAFLDADDVWAPQKLARMAAVFCTPNSPEALYARIGFFRKQLKAVRTQSTVREGVLSARDLLRENAVCTMSNIVVRRSAFLESSGFNNALRYGEDVEWLIRLIGTGARVEGIDELLVFYRTSDAGLSANLRAMHTGWRRTLNLVKRIDPTLRPSEIAAAEAIHLRYLARRALRIQSEPLTALGFVFSALARSPLGFFSDPKRGVLTAAAALAAPVLPRAMHDRTFAN
ncbi:glycosyltransferase family A protein [Notoacmeibacter sp. MSK16QG-6]|uniref:glycosyltransferase family 2 protein n=1 Tax=Notoacmeibacter sp. MSK16QG-6 TaxID=2957982 RepID=UPI00209D5616|nr:glycosyltransferase family A protein [Notoacmeibacter sp. MSK16QG-6]MCP1199067.1 glycosyltransferase family 2 protein [Notoacmeibacter sp. MSK16QG-6]